MPPIPAEGSTPTGARTNLVIGVAIAGGVLLLAVVLLLVAVWPSSGPAAPPAAPGAWSSPGATPEGGWGGGTTTPNSGVSSTAPLAPYGVVEVGTARFRVTSQVSIHDADGADALGLPVGPVKIKLDRETGGQLVAYAGDRGVPVKDPKALAPTGQDGQIWSTRTAVSGKDVHGRLFNLGDEDAVWPVAFLEYVGGDPDPKTPRQAALVFTDNLSGNRVGVVALDALDQP